jgi:hypothetical protein
VPFRSFPSFETVIFRRLQREILFIYRELKGSGRHLKSNTAFAGDEKTPSRIAFQFHTIDKAVPVNTDGQREKLPLSSDSNDLYIDGRLENKE